MCVPGAASLLDFEEISNRSLGDQMRRRQPERTGTNCQCLLFPLESDERSGRTCDCVNFIDISCRSGAGI